MLRLAETLLHLGGKMCSDKRMPVHFNIHVDETNWLAVWQESQRPNAISTFRSMLIARLDNWAPVLVCNEAKREICFSAKVYRYFTLIRGDMSIFSLLVLNLKRVWQLDHLISCKLPFKSTEENKAEIQEVTEA